jgi:hypothetical protein
MTVFEMHLQVNQRLQEVASYKRDKFFPQEIDVALNKAVDRFLQQGINMDFEDAQINLAHVSGLIKKNKALDIYKPSTTDPLYEEQLNNVYSVIPPDLYWLINSRVEIIRDPYNCDTAPTLATTNLPEWKAVVPFPAANGSAPYFPAITVTSTILGTLYTAPAAISAGFQSANSQYILIYDILEELYPHATLKVYWERYRDTYYPNSFIFVSSSNAGTIRIQGTGLTTSSVAMTQTTYTTYNRALISAMPSKEVKLASVKTQEEDTLYSSLQQNSFYNTRQAEVIMDQTFDYFVFYRDESFIITRAYMDYIRKPRTISLLLKQDCELAPSVHHKIVDLAVEILRLDTKDQAYPQTVQDTQLRTF